MKEVEFIKNNNTKNNSNNIKKEFDAGHGLTFYSNETVNVNVYNERVKSKKAKLEIKRGEEFFTEG